MKRMILNASVGVIAACLAATPNADAKRPDRNKEDLHVIYVADNTLGSLLLKDRKILADTGEPEIVSIDGVNRQILTMFSAMTPRRRSDFDEVKLHFITTQRGFEGSYTPSKLMQTNPRTMIRKLSPANDCGGLSRMFSAIKRVMDGHQNEATILIIQSPLLDVRPAMCALDEADKEIPTQAWYREPPREDYGLRSLLTNRSLERVRFIGVHQERLWAEYLEGIPTSTDIRFIDLEGVSDELTFLTEMVK